MKNEQLSAEISSQELATILAALRNWQKMMQAFEEHNVPFHPSHEGFGGYFEEHQPLTLSQIDELCERINFSKPAVAAEDPVITVEGGVIQAVFVPVPGDPKRCKPVSYSLIDYDNLSDGDMSDEDKVEEWNSFSPALRAYYRQSCKEEFEKYFETALNEACSCDERSWHGVEHDSACPVDGER